MSLVTLGITECPLCGKVIGEDDEFVCTTRFIVGPTDPLWEFWDTAIHIRCLDTWEHRDEFIARLERAHLKPGGSTSQSRIDMQKCSYCGRENSVGSTNCRECGTPFVADGDDVQVSRDSGVENPLHTHGEKLMRRGMFWLAGGLAVTLFSFLAVASSGHGRISVIATGAIAFGIAQFLRGRAAASGSGVNAQAQEFLDVAAHFESLDRDKAVALYAEIVSKFPGTRASAEAQRNMQTLLSHRE